MLQGIFRGNWAGRAVVLAAGFIFASGCTKNQPKTTPAVHHAAQQKTFGGDRPVTLNVPFNYDNNKPTPLILVLHGYGATGYEQLVYLEFDRLVDEAGVLVAAPDGTVDATGHRFWNATDACCDFGHTGVDDVGYLTSLIHDISVEWNVDPKRVYLMGHSNGAFMSYRMACDHAELIAGIVSLAGDTYADASKCHPSQAVSVLQIQGDMDALVAYGGGAFNGVAYPGAVQSVQTWAGYDHCTGALTAAGPNLDLDVNLTGAETGQQHFPTCPSDIDVALWTIHGGSHIPAVTDDFHSLVWAWMKAHPKP